MIYKTILFFFLLNTNLLIFSQEKVIKIEYGLTIEPEKDLFKDNLYLKQLLNNSIENAKNESFTLLIKKEGSKFFLNETLSSDERNNVTTAFANYDGLTYTMNGAVFIKAASIGINIFVKKKEVENWTITTETKLIDNYKCYKATNIYQIISPNKVFNHPVIAWFCPDLPYKYGPNGYNNLPGLILELQIRNCVYGVRKIDFNSDEYFSLNELQNIKVLTEKERDDIIEKEMQERR